LCLGASEQKATILLHLIRPTCEVGEGSEMSNVELAMAGGGRYFYARNLPVAST
jgi:hypothetical protein